MNPFVEGLVIIMVGKLGVASSKTIHVYLVIINSIMMVVVVSVVVVQDPPFSQNMSATFCRALCSCSLE